ncbi:MAG: NADH-quinone oxidoreductase subunit N [Pirellulales bacterium]|nr:NADH-quinone oxidoreductase subunit N [Pirellulales bacterium]
MTTAAVYFLLPEILVIATAVTIYVAGAFFHTQWGWGWLALLGTAAAAAVLALQSGRSPAPVGLLYSDGLVAFTRWLALNLAGLLVLLNFRPSADGGAPETLGSLLLTVAGTMLVASSQDLVMMFVSLELISIPTYVLLYLGRRDALNQEAAAKYFYLSVLASAIFLYGLSFLYGVGRSTNLEAIAAALSALEQTSPAFVSFAKLALVLIVAGLAFRLAAVPFHFYAPDVYQGTTHANAALLSVIPKAAALVALLRLGWWAMPGMENFAWKLVLILSLLTMTLGNVTALWQDHLRRLMAYSSIAHAGYLLIGVAVALAGRNASPAVFDGWTAVFFYLCVYALATIGTFAVWHYLGGTRSVEGLDELAGLGKIRPTAAALLALFLFSLTGIPPLAGFWGKLQIFAAAMNAGGGPGGGETGLWFTVLAVIGVLNAAIAAAYYLRIVGVMYFRIPLGAPRTEGDRGALLAAVACAALLVAFSVLPGPLVRASSQAQPHVGQVANLSHDADAP